MSADEFDPVIEREYRYTPHFADSSLFNADVEVRAYRKQLKRRLVMGAFGVVACGVFIQQIVRVNIDWLNRNGVAEAILPAKQVGNVLGTLADVASKAGIDGLAVGTISGPQMLLMCGVGVATLLAGTAVRLSQSL